MSPSPAAPRDRPPASLLPLVVAATVPMVTVNLAAPGAGTLAADLGLSGGAVAASLTAFLLVAALTQIVLGPVSDVIGRRPVLVVGLLAFVAGSLLCAMASCGRTYLLGRVLQAGGAAGLVIGRAMVRDCNGDAATARKLAMLSAGVALVPLVAPALGGVLVEGAGWRTVYVALALYGIAALVLTHDLAESRPRAATARTVAAYRRDAAELAAVPAFRLLALTLGTLGIAYFALVAGADTLQRQFHLSAADAGLVVTTATAGYFAGTLLATSAGRFGPLMAIVGGNALTLVAALWAVAVDATDGPALLLCLPLALLGIGNGVALPNAIAAAVNLRPALAGASMGVVGLAQVGGGALASALVAALGTSGDLGPVLLLMLAGAAASFVVSLLLLRAAEPARA